jgi:hypothetical protein
MRLPERVVNFTNGIVGRGDRRTKEVERVVWKKWLRL